MVKRPSIVEPRDDLLLGANSLHLQNHLYLGRHGLFAV
jgi:hypothetical protein